MPTCPPVTTSSSAGSATRRSSSSASTLTGPWLRRLPALRLVAFTGTGCGELRRPADGRRARDRGRQRHRLRGRRRRRATRLPSRSPSPGAWPRATAPIRAGQWAGAQGYRARRGQDRGASSATAGIGARFASLLEAVGMRVRRVDRPPRPGPADQPGAAVRPTWAELMTASDVVSLHLLLTDDTRGMIDEPLLRSMKPGALLVNTARAELIASGALEAVLADGQVMAALDCLRDRATRRGLTAARAAERHPVTAPGLQHAGEPGTDARRGSSPTSRITSRAGQPASWPGRECPSPAAQDPQTIPG